MVGTDAFGPYGCEDFVDAVYGRTTATGIGHDAALAFYQSLADRGLTHHEMPVPRGALVFSTGADGDHVDISRGDGTYVSGGVQGLWPGYGNGHNVQILPTPTLAPGRCTDGSTRPGSTGRRTRTGNVDTAIRSAAYPHLCIRRAPVCILR